MGRPADWWPVSDTDPVPGDPETLATFGRKMSDVATAIEQLAGTLPKLASSEEWDSDAGEAFRTKARSFAATVGKSRGRFLAVATALGTSPYGGSGYAGALQTCQDEAGSQLKRVTGSSGSEAQRLRAWSRLVEATGGLSPEHPVPKPGSTSGAPRVPAGACPAAAPGQIPPGLPNCPGDSAEVASLKSTYNQALATLRSATLKISQAAEDQASAAQHAASTIRNAIDSDGLNNPTGLHALFHDVASFYDNHVVGVLKAISEISGWIATACGFIAMVLAFIPGMQEFAAAFETLSLLAIGVQLICNLVLAATGFGSWLAVGLDAIALVTMGAAKGLTGTAEDLTGTAAEDAGMTGARGVASGRSFDPEAAGGPIQDLNAGDANITEEGVAELAAHLQRFAGDGPLEAPEQGMLDRLTSIASGDMEPTTYDQNFYTHELDEAGRYAQLGYGPESGVDLGSPDMYDVWNNVHTAALEDYGVSGADLFLPGLAP